MKTKYLIILAISISLVALTVFVAYAQGLYGVYWWSVDSGAGTSQAGNYTITGIIGQPEAGPAAHGGQYTEAGGYWAGITAFRLPIALPIVIKAP